MNIAGFHNNLTILGSRSIISLPSSIMEPRTPVTWLFPATTVMHTKALTLPGLIRMRKKSRRYFIQDGISGLNIFNGTMPNWLA